MVMLKHQLIKMIFKSSSCVNVRVISPLCTLITSIVISCPRKASKNTLPSLIFWLHFLIGFHFWFLKNTKHMRSACPQPALYCFYFQHKWGHKQFVLSAASPSWAFFFFFGNSHVSRLFLYLRRQILRATMPNFFLCLISGAQSNHGHYYWRKVCVMWAQQIC